MIINEENLDLTLTHPTFRQRQPEHYTPPILTHHPFTVHTAKDYGAVETQSNSFGPS